MATVLKTAAFHGPPLPPLRKAVVPHKFTSLSFSLHHRTAATRLSLRFSAAPSLRFVKFQPFASSGETEATQTTQEEIQEPEVEDSLDGAIDVGGDAGEDEVDSPGEEAPTSGIGPLLLSYKEALTSNDDLRVAEIEAFLESIETEKTDLESQVAKLSEELSIERDRVLRISADFDNFRKRTEKERLSLVTNAQGEVVERLLQVLDNFERAKTQIKVDTEGEEKINNSYQSIYKQLVEIFGSLGVVPVETIGKPFDPLVKYRVGSIFSQVFDEPFRILRQLYTAIMREDSDQYDEGIILEEYRKGFKLGDRLLRPSMVKVSAGPGQAKSEVVVPSEGEVDTREGVTVQSTSSPDSEVEEEST